MYVALYYFIGGSVYNHCDDNISKHDLDIYRDVTKYIVVFFFQNYTNQQKTVTTEELLPNERQ